MPARGLDGISRANTSGVLYLGRTTVNSQPALIVELNANQAIAGARIRILNGSSPAAQDTIVNLDPAATYVQTVPGVASNVMLKDDMPAGTVFQQSGSDSHCNQVSSTQVQCDLGDIVNNQPVIVKVAFTTPVFDACVDTAIVNACHSGQGGTGDVAILTAANRMQLMPFAQIATRIGGAITVTLALIALGRM